VHTLAWIVAASVLGGALSVACAGVFALSARSTWVPWLISYAIGALLGAAFLEIVPHALEVATSPEQFTTWLLFGILLFFLLEKLVLWRHYHGDAAAGAQDGHGRHAGDPRDAVEAGGGRARPEADVRGAAHGHGHRHGHAALHAHGSDPRHGREHGGQGAPFGGEHGRSGLMILIGDSFHNFVDGIIIAGAFVADTRLGVVTSIAIIAHEIPQEVGDFLILLHSGYTKRQAFVYNLVASGATLVGSVLAWATLREMRGLIPPLLAIAAASMIYVAVADLIPGLHRRTELRATAVQITLIALGIGSIWAMRALIEHPGG
jgi:zinc and cadmium transporter